MRVCTFTCLCGRSVLSQHLIAQERAAQIAAAELAAQGTDSGAIADAARLLSGAAARGVPVKIAGLGGDWDGVHHTLAASDTDCMLAAVDEATLGPSAMHTYSAWTPIPTARAC